VIVKTNLSVVIIHGAVLRASTRRWMNLLKDHLLHLGTPEVRLFFWNGRANLKAIEEAGSDLSTQLTNWFANEKTKSNSSLSVFAKSSGGLVFRSALEHLANHSISLGCDVLLQAAVPNPVITESTLCSVKKVVNLYSKADWLIRSSFLMGPYKGYRQILGSVNGADECNLHNVEIPALGHKDFNWNTPITTGSWAGRSLYDIYYEILSS
jgi:hypothetical protein